MKENSVISFKNLEQSQDPLTDLLRTGAKQLIHQLVEAELAELLEQHEKNLVVLPTCEIRHEYRYRTPPY